MPISDPHAAETPAAISVVPVEIDRFDQWVDRSDPARVRSCATMVELP